MTVSRWILAGTLALSGAFLVGFAVATQDPMGSMWGDHAVPAVNPDPRVQWTSYPVAGCKLTGRDTTITLPQGATLWVPTVVKDSAFDTD